MEKEEIRPILNVGILILHGLYNAIDTIKFFMYSRKKNIDGYF